MVVVILKVESVAWGGAGGGIVAVVDGDWLYAVLVVPVPADSCWCLMLLLREEIFGRLFAFSESSSGECERLRVSLGISREGGMGAERRRRR